jgi:EAL domain-containing protein (putative c-di-GMP-specific phosphodiesterase class I)
MQRIEGALGGDIVSMVFQPIVTLNDRSVVGFEALARFAAEPQRGPDKWFAEAARVNLGVNLEILAVQAALARVDDVPPGAYLSVNASLDTLLSTEFEAALDDVPAERVVVEISEHAQVEDYRPVLAAMDTLRERGARFAIDDAGGGFDSISHILQMRPDVIKLDTFLTRGIDSDPVRRAVTASLEVIGADVGATLIAESVETQAEISQLRALGVEQGQGMRLGPPGPLPRNGGSPS